MDSIERAWRTTYLLFRTATTNLQTHQHVSQELGTSTSFFIKLNYFPQFRLQLEGADCDHLISGFLLRIEMTSAAKLLASLGHFPVKASFQSSPSLCIDSLPSA